MVHFCRLENTENVVSAGVSGRGSSSRVSNSAATSGLEGDGPLAPLLSSVSPE